MIDQFDSDETIVALATAREPGYLQGIVRLSGIETGRILEHSLSPELAQKLRECRLPTRIDGDFVFRDRSIRIPVSVLFWPGERSYTGQSSAEIHAPGSLPILDGMIQQVCGDGARLAKPGEFTMRAFLGGRIDLTRAEAVLGVIDAKDQKHLDVALRQLSGGLSKPIHQSRNELLHTLAQLEAGLDFVEEDIEFVTAEELLAQVGKCLSDLDRLKTQLASRDQQETGVRLVLFGQPNTGKSSLFNELVRRFGHSSQSALVSSASGTTRDFVASTLRIRGTEIVLVDTAGVDEVDANAEEAEQEDSPLAIGQAQSLFQRQQSTLTIFCLDSSLPVSNWEQQQLAELGPNAIVCRTKSDLVSESEFEEVDLEQSSALPDSTIQVSSKSGDGIDHLVMRILELAEQSEPAESIPSTSIRCRLAVDDAMASLESARQLILSTAGEELVASEIRAALDAIGQITGVVYTDDILDVVFSQFCIGK